MAKSAICKINYNWSSDYKFIILVVKCKYLPSSWWIFAINSKYNLYFVIYIYSSSKNKQFDKNVNDKTTQC